MSRLDLIVGPNGAGKSTFVEFVLATHRPGVPFVNADVIAAQRWPDEPMAHGHDAARAAAEIRDALLDRGELFIAETVASHPSKVDLVRRARHASYHVHLLVVAVPEEFSVARVSLRVAAGGHDVPGASSLAPTPCRSQDSDALMPWAQSGTSGPVLGGGPSARLAI